MKLTRIELQDFRCFGEAVFDLKAPGEEEPLSTALFVGPNGTGKSSVIAALGGLFTKLFDKYGADHLTLDDVRAGKDMARIRAEWLDRVEERPESFSAVVGIFRRSAVVGKQQVPAGVRHLVGEFDFAAYERWLAAAQDSVPREAGLMVSFDAYRMLPPHAVAGPNAQQVVSHRLHAAMKPTVLRTGSLEQRFRQLKQWIVNLDFQRAKAKADRNEESPAWETLRKAIDTIFDPFKFDRVDERFEVLIRTPTGLVPIEALSDGFRSVFIIVTELLRRLSLTTDDPNRLLQQEAVCLIDEIDAHLHPRWQEKALPGLRELFPNVQFIATTHSPIVVSTVAPSEVFRFQEEE